MKAQLEFPIGKALFSTSGYIDYVKISPDGKSVACIEHPVFDDDRGWVVVVDEKGKRTQLTPEYASIQGLVWSKTGKQILYTAADQATDRSLRSVTLAVKFARSQGHPYGCAFRTSPRTGGC